MIGNDWDEQLSVIWQSPNFNKFYNNIMDLYNKETIYPPKDYIFNALKLTPYKDVKVVILGQDPYHGENEAHGLSFSVKNGTPLPPSLKNIFKELYSDVGIKRDSSDLTDWAIQGVLLLNSILTVVKDSPLSHQKKGWEEFTNKIIEKLGERNE